MAQHATIPLGPKPGTASHQSPAPEGKDRTGGQKSAADLEKFASDLSALTRSYVSTTGAAPMMKVRDFPVRDIYVPVKRRATLDPERAAAIAESII